MTPLSNTHTISYKQNGSTLIIDNKFINDWFSNLGRNRQNSPEMANQLLSQFGIKSAVDVIKFLQSPAGKLAEAMLQEKIATLIAQRETSQFMQLQALAKERALAFMILGLLHDKTKAQQHIQAMIEEEQNRNLLHPKKPTPIPAVTITPIDLSVFEPILEQYEEARLSLQTQWELSEQFASALEEDWVLYEEIILLFNQENKIYDRLLDEIYSIHQDSTLDHAFIEQKLAELNRLYEAELDAIHQILESNDAYEDDAIIMRIHNNEGRKLQFFVLHDFQNALHPENKIVQKHGKFYLLPINKTINDLSAEDQSQAHAAYLSLKPSLEKTRTLVNKSRTLEQTQLTEKKQSLLAQTAFVQDQMKLFDNKLSSIQASIANLNLAMTDMQARQTAPTLTLKPTFSTKPTPSPSKNTPAPTPSAHAASCIYRLELCKIRNNQEQRAQLSPQARAHLANTNQATHAQQLEASANLRIRPGAPISPLLMQTLLRCNNGVIAQRNQAMSPIQSPNQIRPPEAPTPFSMSPQMKPKGYY